MIRHNLQFKFKTVTKSQIQKHTSSSYHTIGFSDLTEVRAIFPRCEIDSIIL